MAEGVDNQTESLRLESDDFHEYPCIPCAKDNRNVAAIKYCVDCDENICDKCVSAHDKYAGLKDHQISDTIKTTPSQGRPGLPSQRCDIHAGKLIDVYCADHDFVGCSTCIAIEHRSCEDVKFIPDVAPTLQTSKELQDITFEMQMLQTRIDRLKDQKAKRVCSLNQDKDRILNEIRLLRQKVNDRMDQMEKAMLKEVDYYFNNKNEAVDIVVKEINCFADNITDVQAALNNVKDKNESALFVEVKRSKKTLRSTSVMLKLLENSHFTVSTSFCMSREIENILHITSSFGLLSDSPNFITSPNRDEFIVRLESDQERCEIRNMCLTSTGELVLTDDPNKKVKIFTSCFAIKEYILTPAQPIGVCEVDKNCLAVTLYNIKSVQFLSQNPLKLKEKFSVGDKCRGIQYLEGHLYVGCGGYTVNGEGPGHIEKYDMEGKLLRSYYDSLVCPWYMHIPNNKANASLIVSDLKEKTIKMIDLLNNDITILNLQHVIEPSGSYAINATRQLLISGFGSNNIVVHSEGQQERELLSEKDGIVRPRSIVYDEQKSRLIVYLDKSDIIKVFTFID